jgi:hypothetical protein
LPSTATIYFIERSKNVLPRISNIAQLCARRFSIFFIATKPDFLEAIHLKRSRKKLKLFSDTSNGNELMIAMSSLNRMFGRRGNREARNLFGVR